MASSGGKIGLKPECRGEYGTGNAVVIVADDLIIRLFKFSIPNTSTSISR